MFGDWKFFNTLSRMGTRRHSLPFHVPSSSQIALMDPVEIEIAKERARLGAALIYAQDAGKRQLAEEVYGLPYMKWKYPEVYPSTCARFIDNITRPWW